MWTLLSKVPIWKPRPFPVWLRDGAGKKHLWHNKYVAIPQCGRQQENQTCSQHTTLIQLRWIKMWIDREMFESRTLRKLFQDTWKTAIRLLIPQPEISTLAFMKVNQPNYTDFMEDWPLYSELFQQSFCINHWCKKDIRKLFYLLL